MDFLKFQKKFLRTAWWSLCFLMLQVSAPTRTFFGDSSEEQLWAIASKLFEIFSWNSPIIHLSCLKPFHFFLWKNLIFKNMTLKNNQFTLNSYLKFPKYWYSQILWNLIIFREISLSRLRKLISAKEDFKNHHLQKWVIH